MTSLFHNNTSIKKILSSAISHIDQLDAELLLAHVLDKPREFLIAHPEVKISKLQIYRFQRLVKKRVQNIPLAYLTGHKEFYGLDFIVNKHTLVPRPETELMVELVKEQLTTSKEQTLLIDIGTGSGCLPISIAKTVKQWDNRTMSIYATDISKPALKTAKQNAKRHNVDTTFLHGSLLDPVKSLISNFQFPISSVIITANLPYLTEEQFNKEPSIQKEPKSALVAADQGLALYKELVQQIKSLISNLSRDNVFRDFKFPISLFMEIDPSQATPLSQYIKNHLPEASTTIHKDFCGNDRIVEIKIAH